MARSSHSEVERLGGDGYGRKDDELGEGLYVVARSGCSGSTAAISETGSSEYPDYAVSLYQVNVDLIKSATSL